MSKLSLIFLFLMSSLGIAAERIGSLPIQKDGWLGADAAYTINLDSKTRLWLFGDTFLGKIKDQKRSDTTFINNSIGIEKSSKGFLKLDYFWASERDSFFKPSEKKNWYWPLDGFVHQKKLYIFLNEVKKTKADDVFGFKNVGQDLVIIENPFDSPSKWKKKYLNLTKSSKNTLAVSVEKFGNYLYGLEARLEGDKHHMYLFRISLSQLGSDSLDIEYFSKKEKTWNAEIANGNGIFAGAPEGSLHFDSAKNQWVIMYTRKAMSGVMVSRIAKSIEGPWSDEKEHFICPEKSWNKNYFCYAGKQITPLEGEKKNYFSYVVNSFDFWDTVKDIRIYLPQIVEFNP